MSNSTSIVPLVLWGKNPPSHTTTCINCSYDQKTIITGTVEGQVGLWDLRHTKDGGLKVVPRNLIFAHGCEVISIACAPDGNQEHPNIVSLAANGEMGLWDVEDGICLTMSQYRGKHTTIQSVQVTKGSLKEWRLVLHGLYSDIFILDALTLQIVYTIKSKLSPNWMAAVCVLQPTGTRTKDNMLVGITVSNCLKVWTLSSGTRKGEKIIYEEESKTLDCLKAKSICINPFTQRTALIISGCTWQIFDAGDFSFLAALPAPNKVALVKGDFVAANRVIIWNKSGNAFLYKLPSRYLLGADQIDTHISEKSSRTPTLICEFPSSPGVDSVNCPMVFSYGRRGPYYKLLIQGLNGGICVWKVPDSELEDQLFSKLRSHSFKQRQQQKHHTSAEMMIADEGVRKTVTLEENYGRVVHHTALVTLENLWNETSPSGLLDNLITEDNGDVDVTSSLYLPSHGKMVCGRSNGTIVIIDTIRAAIKQLMTNKSSNNNNHNHESKEGEQNKDQPSFLIFRGHNGAVTCILYPHDENPRYDKCHMISGGADFTVRVWDLANRCLLHTFSCHGGEVLRLMVTPPHCGIRFQQCICSVGEDHSVAICGLRERKILLLASRHTFPVSTIRWRVTEDFMVVGCSDGSVYVWQMETGHLDRCVAGTIAMDILESCNEDTSAPSAAVREHHRKFRLHSHLTNMAHQLPFNIKTPVVVNRVKTQVSALHQHVTGVLNKGLHSQQQPQAAEPHQQKAGIAQLPPLRVCALRTTSKEPDLHVILLDPEALIKLLLADEARLLSQKETSKNGNKRPETSQDTPCQNDSQQKSQSKQILNNKIYEIAQLLLSSVHAWGLDSNLDTLCRTKLGMLQPKKPISFGLLTRGRLAVMFPGWYVSGREEDIAGKLESGETPEQINTSDSISDEEDYSKVYYNSHWQLSSSLTTQHVVSVVAVCNTLMSMNYASLNKNDMGDSSNLAGDNRVTSLSNSEIKAGWSLLATLHCCMLPDSMKGLQYRPPLLHILARRWQDRCLEIREAAQAILLGELRRIGSIGRKRLIDAWSPHLPQDLESADFGFEDLEQYINSEDEKTVFVSADEERHDIAMVMMTTKKMVSSDVKLRHATAIIMLGVIGAEFQKEIDPLNKNSGKTKQEIECSMDVNVLRNTALALTGLLLKRQSTTTTYSAIRRAAIDLIGRGFALWEPYIDVSQVLIGLFELCADIEQHIRVDRGRSFSMTAAKDLHRSSKHSLSLIATAKPSVLITTLAKEVARHVTSSSSMSFTQPAPAAIAVYSHVRHQPNPAHETPTSNTLHHARSEILRVMELMIEKSQQEVITFIVEVADIIIHMLDFKQLKDRGITEAFPSLFKFSMVTYCSHTRRLAVGSRVGHIALYELRSSRCQVIPAHENSITALAFSPEGKVLASFSLKDKKISFYQTSSSLLGMLSSTVKCIQSYSVLISDEQSTCKNVRILWTTKKAIILLLGDGTQFKFAL